MWCEKGFFLVETIVLGIIMVAVISVFAVYQVTGEMRFDIENHITATFLAQKQLAMIEASPTILQETTSLSWLDREETMPLKRNGQDFYIDTLVSDTEAAKLKKVKIYVHWTIKNSEKRIFLQRLVPCYE
ncbi:MAG: hypothetical protein WCS30_12380 [Selenomonadaceae bacterium]